MSKYVWCLPLARDEDEALKSLTEGLTKADFLRAAVDLLLSLVFVRKPRPYTAAVIAALRANANTLGFTTPNCRRVVIDIVSLNTYCG